MLHAAYSVKFGDTLLAGITNIDSQTNPEVDASVGIGSQFPQFAVVRSVKPRIAFQSRAIDAALTALGTTGAAISDTDNLVANYVAMTADGAIGTTGRAYTLDRGLVMPRQLQVAHRSDAVLDIEALSYSSDGVASPMAFGDATIAALTRDNIRHTLKSVTIAGVTFDCNTQVTINFGINADTLGCDSDLYDTHIIKDSGITPTIDVTSYDVAKLEQLTLDGKRGTSTIVLRQYDDEGIGFAAGVDANDITLTARGIANFQGHSGQGPQTSSGTVRITCDWDGTNAPLILS